jgi:hypothetical protein
MDLPSQTQSPHQHHHQFGLAAWVKNFLHHPFRGRYQQYLIALGLLE